MEEKERERKGEREGEREARRKKRTPPSLALLFSSPLLSSSRCYSTLSCSRTFPLPIPRLVPSWHPKFALRNPPGWLRRPPSIHPFFAPRKANDLLFSWLGPISPLRGRIIHARVTLHARVYTPLYSFAKRFFLFSFFFSSSSPREIKTNGNRMANMIR